MNLTSKLEAVNTILATIGEAPLNSLDKAFTSDATVAVRLLDEVSRETQMDGWSFNTDYQFNLSKDTSGNVFVSDNVLRIQFNRNTEFGPTPVLRGRQLYDVDNQTYTFSNDVKVDQIVWLFDWDDLPESCRRYITIRAARIFAARNGGGQEIHSYTQEEELTAKIRFVRDESKEKDHNIFKAPGVSRIVNRRSHWTWGIST
jgi:hypothetical protein